MILATMNGHRIKKDAKWRRTLLNTQRRVVQKNSEETVTKWSLPWNKNAIPAVSKDLIKNNFPFL